MTYPTSVNFGAKMELQICINVALKLLFHI